MMNSKEDMYHCCNYCKYFDKGKCYKGFADLSVTYDVVYSVAENGRLSEVIEEELNSHKPVKAYAAIRNKLTEYGLSKKTYSRA